MSKSVAGVAGVTMGVTVAISLAGANSSCAAGATGAVGHWRFVVAVGSLRWFQAEVGAVGGVVVVEV
jgi:hypothetical protein